MSHPSRVRGLKSRYGEVAFVRGIVAPFTGAWIEIWKPSSLNSELTRVAPFTGAWIEMSTSRCRAVQGS